MRLSIIVPAYKVATFIEKCIRSLEDQDIPKSDYEIIVTNDGSPDNSRQIVERLQREFSNIILINQENQGVSMARNNALSVATGTYVLPIDPDDYVLPNTFNRALSLAENRDLDVLYLGFENFDLEGNSIYKADYSHHGTKIYNGVDGYFLARGASTKDPDRSWAILYRNSILKKYDITYPKGVPFLEDGLFLGKVFSIVDTVSFDDAPFYNRTSNESSAIGLGIYYSNKAINGFLLAAQDISEFGNKHNFNNQQKGLINHVTVIYVLQSFFPLFNVNKILTFPRIALRLKKAGFIKLPTDGVISIYYKYAKYYNISPYYFFVQYVKELGIKKIQLRLKKK